MSEQNGASWMKVIELFGKLLIVYLVLSVFTFAVVSNIFSGLTFGTVLAVVMTYTMIKLIISFLTSLASLVISK
jgi:hypothetical protein